MKTSQSQTLLNGQGKLTFYPEGFHANHSQLQVKEKAQQITAISGRKCLEQFERLPRAGLWARTFAALLIGREDWYSSKCALTWKLKVTKSSRSWFQLAVSMPRTDATGFGLLPTPVAQEPGKVPEGSTSHGNYFRRPDGSKISSSINLLAKEGLLPTPTASDYQARAKTENWSGSDLVSTMHELTNQPGKTSQLNPRFVAEMMGFPVNWTELPFQSGETNQ